MKEYGILFAAILSIILIVSCENNSTDDLIEHTPNQTSITYANNIESIITFNCLSCHSTPPQNGAPMSLETIEDVKNAIITRGLIDRISRTEGSQGAMPQGGPRLPQETIDDIITWATNSFPE